LKEEEDMNRIFNFITIGPTTLILISLSVIIFIILHRNKGKVIINNEHQKDKVIENEESATKSNIQQLPVPKSRKWQPLTIKELSAPKPMAIKQPTNNKGRMFSSVFASNEDI
jgi:hypothetical protein